MADIDARKEFDSGLALFKAGNILRALGHFEKAMAERPTSLCASYYAYCVAKERGHVKKGIALCREALEKEPGTPVHYLILARIHLLGRNKDDAITVLREGVQHAPDPEINDLLDHIGVRKQPVVSSMPRDSFVNKYLGLLLSKLGLR
jgi:tetratricopeptide (TPR) repeat protein